MEATAGNSPRERLAPSDAFRRVLATAEHRVVEAAGQFSQALQSPGFIHLCAGGGPAVDPAICRIAGDDNYLITGTRTHLPGLASVDITGHRNVVFIGAWARYQRLRVTITGDDNIVFVGWSSSGGDVHLVTPGNGRVAMIGDECMLSSPITIGTETELSVVDASGAALPDRLLGPPPAARARTVVDDRVWIGRDISISSGVHVGSRSVIGQCAVVTQDVPGGSIVAGAPATVLRSGVTFSRAIETDSLEGPDEGSRKAMIVMHRSKLVLQENAGDDEVTQLDVRIARPSPGVAPAAFSAEGVLTAKAAEGLADALNRVVRVGRPASAESLTGAPHDAIAGFDAVGEVSSKWRRVSGRDNAVIAEKGARATDLNLTIIGQGNVVYIAPDAVLYRTTIQVRGDGNVIYVGRGSTIDDRALLLLDGQGATLSIGEDCAIGVGTVLANADGGLVLADDGELAVKDADVRIGDHVAIGAYVRIHNGAQIADGAFVAAGAWAGGEMEADALYAGSPAACVAHSIAWRRERASA